MTQETEGVIVSVRDAVVERRVKAEEVVRTALERIDRLNPEDVAGMRTTQGSLLFADAPPATADGLVPARLRSAGAIVVGKTNLPEFATEGFTSNLLFGTTRNPWAPDWSTTRPGDTRPGTWYRRRRSSFPRAACSGTHRGQ